MINHEKGGECKNDRFALHMGVRFSYYGNEHTESSAISPLRLPGEIPSRRKFLPEILGRDCHKFSARRARKQVPYIVSEKYFAQIYTEQFGKSGARMSLTCRRFKLSAHSGILLSSATPDNENLRWWKVRIVFQSVIGQFHCGAAAQSNFCLKINLEFPFPKLERLDP